MSRTIGDVMVGSPVCVDESASLENARRLLERYQVRHMPVLKQGKVVGVLSERELNVALAVARTSNIEATVLSAMQSPAFQVEKGVALGDVAQTMAENKYGCAVVVERGEIKGIFTTTDALKLLAQECREQEKRKER